MKIRKSAIVKTEQDVAVISFDPSKYTVEDVVNTVADAFDDTKHHANQATLIYLNYSPTKPH